MIYSPRVIIADMKNTRRTYVKPTEAQINEMRALRAAGEAVKAIAFRFDCSLLTVSQVTQDAIPSRTQPRECRSHRKKNGLTNAQQLAIKAMHAKGVSQREISRQVGVSVSTVNLLVSDKVRWRFRDCAPQRCPGCGGKVVRLPCVLCCARKLRDRARARGELFISSSGG